MPSANQIAFLFFLFSFISFSQTKEIDSLFRYSRYSDLEVLLFERRDLQRDDLYLAQSRYFNTFNQLEESFESLYAIDTTDLSPRQKAHYYNNLADAYDLNSNFDLAARNFVQAQNYYKKVGDMLSYNDINLDLFYTVANPDIYNEPVDYLDAFQDLALELEDPLQLVSLEMELAFESLETQDSTAIFLEHIDKAYDLLEKDYDAYKLGVVHTFHAFYYTDVIIDKD